MKNNFIYTFCSMDQYLFHGYQRRFLECWNTTVHDGFLNALLSRIFLSFSSDKPWCLNTSVDYGNEQYKPNLSNFIKLICLKFKLVLTKILTLSPIYSCVTNKRTVTIICFLPLYEA